MGVSAATLSALGRLPSGMMVCPRNTERVVPVVAFGRESLELYFRKRCRKRVGADVYFRRVVESNDIVEKCFQAAESSDDLVDDAHKMAGRLAGTIGILSHSKSGVGVAKVVGGIMSGCTGIW